MAKISNSEQRKKAARKLVDSHIQANRIQDLRIRAKTLASLANVTYNQRHDSYEVNLDGLTVYFMVRRFKSNNRIRLEYLCEYAKESK